MIRRKTKDLTWELISAIIKDWDCYYHFGVETPPPKNPDAEFDIPHTVEYKGYDETLAISLKCEICEDKPGLKLFKGTSFDVHIHFFHNLDKYPINHSRSIGAVFKKGTGGYWTQITLSKNSADYIFKMLSSGQAKGITMIMCPLYHNKAEIRTFEILSDLGKL